MLVLTRKPHQSILIGNDIVVTVTRVRGDQVTLGIHAPDSVAVDREEIRIRKDAGLPPPQRRAYVQR